jgi:hypothetical protein
MAEVKNVLSLDTATEHHTVSVDGVEYDLVNSGELTILEHHQLSKRAARVALLNADVENLTDEQVLELSEHLAALCRVVLRAPAEVHARFSDVQRMQIAKVFTRLQSSQGVGAAGADAPSTGASK